MVFPPSETRGTAGLRNPEPAAPAARPPQPGVSSPPRSRPSRRRRIPLQKAPAFPAPEERAPALVMRDTMVLVPLYLV